MPQFPLLLGHKLSFHSFLLLLPSLSSLSASLGVWRPVYSTEIWGLLGRCNSDSFFSADLQAPEKCDQQMGLGGRDC